MTTTPTAAAATPAATPVIAPATSITARELIALIVLTVATLVLRIAIAVNDGGPTLYFDEAYYIENARALFELAPYATAHYPPLYSLLLAPGQLAEDWYPVTMAISAAASALTVPAAWFLGRSVGLRWPLVAAAVAAASPAYLAYAGYMMSENLSTPLFVVAIALACRGRAREGWLLGLALAGLIGTKYLFLPAAFILFVMYLVVRRKPGRGWRLAESARAAVPVVVPIAVLGLGWLAYAMASGFSLFEAAGLGVPSSTLGRGASDGDPKFLLLWLTIYCGILLLPTLPAVLAIVVYAGRPRSAGLFLTRPQAIFAVGLAVLVVTYLATTVQHSFGAYYNYPEPSRAWGRYLMHLSPTLILLGLLLLQRLGENRAAVRPLRVLAALVVTLAAGLAAWRILYYGWIFGMPRWSFDYPLTAADVFPFRTLGTVVMYVAATVVVGGALMWRPRWAAAIGCGVVVAALVLSSVTYLVRSFPIDEFSGDRSNVNGSLPRKLFATMDADGVAGSPAMFVLADGLNVRSMEWDTRFWDVDPDTVAVARADDLGLEVGGAEHTSAGAGALLTEVADLEVCAPPVKSCYLVTKTPLESVGSRLDDRWGQAIYFTRVP